MPQARLSAAARRAFERQYATVEITDSVAMMGGHQVGLMRGYYDELQRAVDALERDVLNDGASYHEMTADSRQGRGRRAARTPPGHGDEPTALACARATAGEEQAGAGYRSVDTQHATRHLARRRGRQSGVSCRNRPRPRHVAAAVGGSVMSQPHRRRHLGVMLLSAALLVALGSPVSGTVGGP